MIKHGTSRVDLSNSTVFQGLIEMSIRHIHQPARYQYLHSPSQYVWIIQNHPLPIPKPPKKGRDHPNLPNHPITTNPDLPRRLTRPSRCTDPLPIVALRGNAPEIALLGGRGRARHAADLRNPGQPEMGDGWDQRK